MTAKILDPAAVVLARAVPTADGCLVYNGTDNGQGYKTIAQDYAHRYVYEAKVAPIPAGYQVDHLCFVRACVNPAHLEAVTPQENFRRAMARKTECTNGHPLPPFEPGKNRPCAPCHAAREAKRRERIRNGERPPVEIKAHQHGTTTGYHYGCRCDECKAAYAAHRRLTRPPTGLRPGPQPIRHGTTHAYNVRGCRCDECRAANAESQRRWKARKAAREAAA